MWQRTLLLLKYRSFWVRLCRHRTTCIAFFLFQAPTPRPGFSSQASDQGWTWWQGERLPEGVGEVSFFTERCVNLCSPWGRPCSKLPDPWRIKRLYTYAPTTCPAMTGNWRRRSGLACAVPHLYRCTGIPFTLSQNIPVSQVPITASACSLTIMTATLKSRLDKWSERTPDCVGRERIVNMVTVSSHTLPLILQRLFASMRDNASSCSS